MSTRSNGSGQMTVRVSPVEQQSMTQVQHKLDSPTYVISDDKEIREGQEAWSRLKKHMSWSDWTSVGRAHLKGRQAAMREANTNEPTGRRYNQIFGEWLTRHGFDDIDKGDRSRLFEVMEHLDEIETWLATLPTSNRLRLNHPATVLRKWHAKTLGIYARALDSIREGPLQRMRPHGLRLAPASKMSCGPQPTN
jgi:hypothetical protein